MELQNKFLKSFLRRHPHIKLREIAEKTGINISRVFRILNGSAMKLEEFQKLCKSFEFPWMEDVFIMAYTLAPEEFNEIKDVIMRVSKKKLYESKSTALNIQRI